MISFIENNLFCLNFIIIIIKVYAQYLDLIVAQGFITQINGDIETPIKVDVSVRNDFNKLKTLHFLGKTRGILTRLPGFIKT
jgi:hypothetical protein